MLNEMMVLALIFLIGSHTLLIKKCFKIEGEIPFHFGEFGHKADVIEHNLSVVKDLLDEALDVLVPMTPQVQSNPANMGIGETIASALLSRLIPTTDMGDANGNSTQQNERQIYEIEQTQTQPEES